MEAHIYAICWKFLRRNPILHFFLPLTTYRTRNIRAIPTNDPSKLDTIFIYTYFEPYVYACVLVVHKVVLTVACDFYIKLKWSRYRPGVAQRVGRVIVLLFHDRGTRRGWVFSSTPRPHFTPGKDPVPILQEAGWAPGPVWTGGISRPHRDSIPDRPARSQSLYRLSYRPTILYIHK